MRHVTAVAVNAPPNSCKECHGTLSIKCVHRLRRMTMKKSSGVVHAWGYHYLVGDQTANSICKRGAKLPGVTNLGKRGLGLDLGLFISLLPDTIAPVQFQNTRNRLVTVKCFVYVFFFFVHFAGGLHSTLHLPASSSEHFYHRKTV